MHVTRLSIKPNCRHIKSKLIANARKNTNNIWLQMHTRGVGTQLGYQWKKTNNLKTKERKFIWKQ
jgi:hypothetical protein